MRYKCLGIWYFKKTQLVGKSKSLTVNSSIHHSLSGFSVVYFQDDPLPLLRLSPTLSSRLGERNVLALPARSHPLPTGNLFSGKRRSVSGAVGVAEPRGERAAGGEERTLSLVLSTARRRPSPPARSVEREDRNKTTWKSTGGKNCHGGHIWHAGSHVYK